MLFICNCTSHFGKIQIKTYVYWGFCYKQEFGSEKMHEKTIVLLFFLVRN